MMLTVNQVAERLNVSRGTVYDMIRKGKIPPPIRLSAKTTRWPEETLRQWIAAGCPPAEEFEAQRNEPTPAA